MIIHFLLLGGYIASRYITGSIKMENAMDLEHTEIEMDIPPELIGGDTSPAPVEKQEWIEGTKKIGADVKEEDINTNKISGDGTDEDGFLFTMNGDKAPQMIMDFDVNQYYPAAAKAANIKRYVVTLYIQVDETGKLITANIASGKAQYGFNEEALRMVKNARFSPGYRDGKRVKMSRYLIVNFVMPD
jgi:periplasmic protein TonB